MEKLPKIRVSFFRSAPLRRKAQKIKNKIYGAIDKKPLTSFVVILIVLFTLIAASSFIRKPKIKTSETNQPVKEVQIYKLGGAPKITLQAKVEKAGVIDIVAQTPGIVSKINVEEDKQVWRGQNLISLSTNYQGGNTQSISRQIAEAQNKNTGGTYDTQKDLIAKERDLANKVDAQNDDLRDITRKSASDTQSLVDLNNDILNGIDSHLQDLIDTNVGGIHDAVILQTKELKSQFLSANNGAKASLRSSQYSADSEKNQALISNLNRDIAGKQLDLQQKSLDLNKEVSALSLKLSQVMEAQMYPVAPFEGTIEKVHVRLGQSVNPGTSLVTIANPNQKVTVVVLAPLGISRNISKIEPSYLKINGQRFETKLINISTEATDGSLYSVIFGVPEEAQKSLADKSFVALEVPIGYDVSGNTTPFIPLDSVHQTQEKAFVFVNNNGSVKNQEITLGQVQGSFVEVKEGLLTPTEIILNRNVVAGDKVKIIN